ncbi:hypothetical protein, partial [Porphyromonas gingivalis]|uniref:hypothetical protein n=1 Tax=Porphyromonas gingivalis TaxID=837 RepID=UPI001F2FC524
STAKIQIIRYFFKHNAHVLWAFTTNQKTNPLAFSYVELTLRKGQWINEPFSPPPEEENQLFP